METFQKENNISRFRLEWSPELHASGEVGLFQCWRPARDENGQLLGLTDLVSFMNLWQLQGLGYLR